MHRGLLVFQLLLSCLGSVRSFCPSQCTCAYHGRSDSTGVRSVLCDDPDMSEIPTNVPVDTVKLRVEKTSVRRLPAEAFYYLPELRYLWVTYDAVASVDAGTFYNLKVLHELRLDGNQLTAFPWDSLREMPSLRTLDLHNNRLLSVPAEAGPLLLNITYLDLSSNRISVLPSDLMDIWLPFSGVLRSHNSTQRVVLGLQDNPWHCDCRISKLIELSKMEEIPVVLLDPYLTCSSPENMAGLLFQRVELEQCLKPTVLTSATKITSPLGSNVLLRCDATGLPTPALFWTRSDGSLVNSTVVQESPGEGIRWSILSLNGILVKDAGEYGCKAKNVAGTSRASITLTVVGDAPITISPRETTRKPGKDDRSASPAQADSAELTEFPPTEHNTTTVTTTTTTTTQSPIPARRSPAFPDQQKAPVKVQPSSPEKKLPQDKNDSSSSLLTEQNLVIKDIRVLEESTEGVVLAWRAEGARDGSTSLTVVYSPYEEKIKQTVVTELGIGKVALEGLKPATKYMACLIAKGGPSRRDQCITFSTLVPLVSEGHSQTLAIAGGVACAVALPLIILLVYKILGLCCRKGRSGSPEEDHSKETYVKFETITMKQRSAAAQANDLWTRRQTQDSERLLLCSRSSIDSQITYKSDSSRSEYLC